MKQSELRQIIKEELEEMISSSSQLASAINFSMSDIDQNMSYKDFAMAVASVLRDNYGTHNYQPFMDELTKNLS
jgi:hypothetical protein